MLGDINLDHTRRKRNDVTDGLIAEMSVNGFKQYIEEPTRRTNKTATLLDVLYVKSSKKIKPFVVHLAVSDHYMIGCYRYLNYTTPPKDTIFGRSYRNYSADLAENYYRRQRRDLVYMYNDVDQVWNILFDFIRHCANSLCPESEMHIPQNKNPWISKEIIEKLNERDSAFLKAYNSKLPADLKHAKELRTEAKRAVRNARADFIKSNLEEHSNNPRKYWEEINKLIKHKSSEKKIELKDLDNSIIPDETAATYINNYFSSIGPNLEKKFDTTLNTFPENNTHLPHLTIPEITQSELLKGINSINTHKSCGISGLSSRLIKDAMIIMLPEFAYHFNLSMHTGKIPSDWKIATPIPKISNPTDVSDLRPISLLPLPGKLLEKYIHSFILDHLEFNKYFSNTQFGFRPGRSTTDAITTLIDDIGINLNNKQLTLATFIDFCKAFDTLNHNILLNRLKTLNFNEKIINWFDSYLSGRQQKTFINNVYSDLKPISTGVPQGSIMGPFLFIIYVNGLTSIAQTAHSIMYADDTVIYTAISKRPTLTEIEAYQLDLNNISNWCKRNKLSVNSQKTKVMILGTNSHTKNITLPCNIGIDQHDLDITNTYKYLGVLLDSNLLFKEHNQNTIGLTVGKINTLSFLKKYVNHLTLLNVYKTTILPILEYANIITPLFPKSIILKKQRLQNRALRVIFSHDQYLNREELHCRAKLKSITESGQTNSKSHV